MVSVTPTPYCKRTEVAALWGHDETQAGGVGEVAAPDGGAAEERAERSGVLPSARAVRAALLRLEEEAQPGRSVMVEPGFNAAHLRAVLAALEGRG